MLRPLTAKKKTSTSSGDTPHPPTKARLPPRSHSTALPGALLSLSSRQRGPEMGPRDKASKTTWRLGGQALTQWSDDQSYHISPVCARLVAQVPPNVQQPIQRIQSTPRAIQRTLPAPRHTRPFSAPLGPRNSRAFGQLGHTRRGGSCEGEEHRAGPGEGPRDAGGQPNTPSR